jgi:hypothetical protein
MEKEIQENPTEEIKETEAKETKEVKEESGFQKRIDKLTAEKYALKSSLEEANTLLAEKIESAEEEPEKKFETEDDFVDPAMKEVNALKKKLADNDEKTKKQITELNKLKLLMLVEKAAKFYKIDSSEIVQEMVNRKSGFKDIETIGELLKNRKDAAELAEIKKERESKSGVSEGASQKVKTKFKTPTDWKDAAEIAKAYIKEKGES